MLRDSKGFLEFISYTAADTLLAKAELGEAAHCLTAHFTADEGELYVGDDVSIGLVGAIRVFFVLLCLGHDGDAGTCLGVETYVFATEPVELEGGDEADVVMTCLAAVFLAVPVVAIVLPNLVHVAIGSGVSYVAADADNRVDVVVVLEREDGELVGVAIAVAGVVAASDDGGDGCFHSDGCEVGDAVEDLGGGSVTDGYTEFVTVVVERSGLSVCVYTYCCATEDEGGCDEEVS